MSVLLIGGSGKIGKRYSSILNWNGVEHAIYDPKHDAEPDIEAYTHWIIASPTDTHYRWCLEAIRLNKTFLCEKPLSKSIMECNDLAARDYKAGFVVCNYKYAIGYRLLGIRSLSYDYYNTGADGLFWDCCQLINIFPKVLLDNKSPVWKVRVNGKYMDLRTIENSYVRMLNDFVTGDYGNLWTLADGLKMTSAVKEREAIGV